MKDESKCDCGDHIQTGQHIDECCNLRSAKGMKGINKVSTHSTATG